MMRRLLPDWREILRHAWSVRLIVVAGLLSGVAVGLSLVDARILGMDPIWFAAVSALVNAAALIARLLVQRSMPGRAGE